MPKKSSSAFTLVELMIVIAIIGVLVGLLIPVIENARQESRMVSCLNNLKQISHAIESYQAAYNTHYPPWLSTTNLYQSPALLVCPNDSSGGDEGSRPDWISQSKTSQFAETNDMDPDDFSKYDNVNQMDGKRYGDLYWYYDNFEKELGGKKRRTEKYRRSLRTNSKNLIKGASYLYELNGECVSWGGYEGMPDGASWYEAKMFEKEYCSVSLDNPAMAGRIPAVRCFFHVEPRGDGQLRDQDQPEPNVPALRLSGKVDKSWPRHWESDRKITTD